MKYAPRSTPSAIVSLSLLSAVPWLPLPAHWKSPRKMIRISSHLVCTVNRLIGAEMSSIHHFHAPGARLRVAGAGLGAIAAPLAPSREGDHRRCPEGTGPLVGAGRRLRALAPGAGGCSGSRGARAQPS